MAPRVSADGKLGAMVEVNCETDFVAKNDSFLALVPRPVPKLVASTTRPTWPRCRRCRWPGRLRSTVEDVRKGLVGKIGENMSIRRFKRYRGGGKLATTCTAPASACWSRSAATRLAKDVAMHIAAMKPKALVVGACRPS
jgi:elongation factor Ts